MSESLFRRNRSTEVENPWLPGILIVEDHTPDLMAPYALMSQLGFRVTLAFDGDQGLALLGTGRFELIILDWNMPHVSGSEFLRRLEERAATSRGPPFSVILHSGENLRLEDFPGGEGYRVIDVWRKPLPVLEMARRLKQLELSGRKS